MVVAVPLRCWLAPTDYQLAIGFMLRRTGWPPEAICEGDTMPTWAYVPPKCSMSSNTRHNQGPLLNNRYGAQGAWCLLSSPHTNPHIVNPM
jgi:hypothetical protein